MTAKILQLVNSSFFGRSQHISDISQAVIMLGLNTIRSLVLTVGIFSKLDASTMTAFNMEKIYEHSIKTGTIAQKNCHTRKCRQGNCGQRIHHRTASRSWQNYFLPQISQKPMQMYLNYHKKET